MKIDASSAIDDYRAIMKAEKDRILGDQWTQDKSLRNQIQENRHTSVSKAKPDSVFSKEGNKVFKIGLKNEESRNIADFFMINNTQFIRK